MWLQYIIATTWLRQDRPTGALDGVVATSAERRMPQQSFGWYVLHAGGAAGIDYLEYALRAMAVVDLPGSVKLHTIAVLNALVRQFARAEVDGRAANRSRRLSQVTYVPKIAEAGDHRYPAAALENSNRGAEPPEDLFEILLRRVLRGVPAPGGSARTHRVAGRETAHTAWTPVGPAPRSIASISAAQPIPDRTRLDPNNAG